jgi:hypothetical protein
VPEGCQGQQSNYTGVRGGIFKPNASTTWGSIGTYELAFEQSLGYADLGEFGFDTGKSTLPIFALSSTDKRLVGLGYQRSGGPTINHSVVAGVAGTNFWLGLLGLTHDPPTLQTSMIRNQACSHCLNNKTKFRACHGSTLPVLHIA